jgi:Protein of unknown function (DUF2917)
VSQYVFESTGPITVQVAGRSVTAIRHGSPTELKCLGGVLWVTERDKTCDWILASHQTQLFPDSGLLVVTAVNPGPASFSLTAKEPRPGQGRGSALGNVRNLFSGHWAGRPA